MYARSPRDENHSRWGPNENDFLGLLTEKAEWLKKNGVSILREEMDRFLPAAYRDTYQSKYSDICGVESRVFSQIAEGLRK